MIETPLISVLMPVYNAGKYLDEAIQSVLNQSYPHFELMMVNDGSTDESLKIMTHYAELDERVVAINNIRNSGISQCLNQGIALAKGQYIARMDADDISLPERFAVQLNWLKNTDSDICGSWIQCFGTHNTHIIKHPQTDAANKVKLLFGACFAHPTVMMKTEHAKKLQYRKNYDNAEDYDLWVRAATIGLRMTNVPQVLLRYRMHASQMSSARSLKQQEVAQTIRRKYWQHLFSAGEIKPAMLDDMMKLQSSLSSNVNMDEIDQFVMDYLHRLTGEAKDVALEYFKILYYRAACKNYNISIRWYKINKRHGKGSGMKEVILLLILSVFAISPTGKISNHLKNLFPIRLQH